MVLGRLPDISMAPTKGPARTMDTQVGGVTAADIQAGAQRQFLKEVIDHWNTHFVRNPLNWVRVQPYLPEDTDPAGFLEAIVQPTNQIMDQLTDLIKHTSEFLGIIAQNRSQHDNQEKDYQARFILISAMNSALANLNDELVDATQGGFPELDKQSRQTLDSFIAWFNSANLAGQAEPKVNLVPRSSYELTQSSLFNLGRIIHERLAGQNRFMEKMLENKFGILMHYVKFYITNFFGIDFNIPDTHPRGETTLQRQGFLEVMTQLAHAFDPSVNQTMVFMALASTRLTPFLNRDGQLLDERQFRADLIKELETIWNTAKHLPPGTGNNLQKVVAQFSIGVLKQNILPPAMVPAGRGTGASLQPTHQASGASAAVVPASNGPRFRDVVEALKPVASKYKSLGVQLELKMNDLRAIERNYPRDCYGALEEVLDLWYRSGGDISWQTILDALRSGSMNENSLAAGIQKKYLAPQNTLSLDDILEVTGYLDSVDKQEMKTLGMYLGLSNVTVMNSYEGSGVSSYCQDIITAWLRGQDKFKPRNWKTLAEALRKPLLRHNGIADRIQRDHPN